MQHSSGRHYRQNSTMRKSGFFCLPPLASYGHCQRRPRSHDSFGWVLAALNWFYEFLRYSMITGIITGRSRGVKDKHRIPSNLRVFHFVWIVIAEFLKHIAQRMHCKRLQVLLLSLQFLDSLRNLDGVQKLGTVGLL